MSWLGCPLCRLLFVSLISRHSQRVGTIGRCHKQSNARRTGPANSESCSDAAFPRRLVTSSHFAPCLPIMCRCKSRPQAHTTAHTTAKPVGAPSHPNISKNLPGTAEDYSHFEGLSSVVAGHSDVTAPTARDLSRFRLLACVW